MLSSVAVVDRDQKSLFECNRDSRKPIDHIEVDLDYLAFPKRDAASLYVFAQPLR